MYIYIYIYVYRGATCLTTTPNIHNKQTTLINIWGKLTRRNRLSNATYLTRGFFKSGE